MATLKRKIQVERAMRKLMEEGGVPPPDEIEYGYGCVRFLYHEKKLCFIVDIDDPDSEDYGEGSEEIEEAAAGAELN